METIEIQRANGKPWRLYIHKGSWSPGIKSLMQDNLKIITARDLAEARILNGVNGSLNAMGTWVGECFIYMPNGDILVASREHNPLLKLEFAKEATRAHRERREFYFNADTANMLRNLAERDAVKAIESGVLLLERQVLDKYGTSEKGKIIIPVSEFGEEPLTQFLFRDMAKPYGNFLKEFVFDNPFIFLEPVIEKGIIKNIPLCIANKKYAQEQEMPFCCALCIDRIGQLTIGIKPCGKFFFSAISGFNKLNDSKNHLIGIRDL